MAGSAVVLCHGYESHRSSLGEDHGTVKVHDEEDTNFKNYRSQFEGIKIGLQKEFLHC